MPDPAMIPPARRPELLLRPLGDGGQYVVKDPRTGDFYMLGEHEYFLLARLDGKQPVDVIRAAFAERFGELLAEEDLREFLALAEAQGFLQVVAGANPAFAAGSRGPQAD